MLVARAMYLYLLLYDIYVSIFQLIDKRIATFSTNNLKIGQL